MRSSATFPLEETADEPSRRSYTVRYLQNHDRLLLNHLRNPSITVRIVTILSFYSLKPTFLAAALLENFKNSSKDLLQQGHQLRHPWGQLNTPFLLFTILLLYSYSSADLFTEYIFFSFCSFSVLSTFKPLRNWLIRLWFLPINPTSSALVHWET